MKKKTVSVLLTAVLSCALLAGCGVFGNGGRSSSVPAQSAAPQSAQLQSSAAPQSSAPAQSAASSAAQASSQVTSGAGGADEPSASLPGSVGQIQTNDKEFNKKFAANPIDKAYITDSVNAVSNQDMINAANKYAGIWSKEIDSAFGKVTKLAKGAQLDQIRAGQNDWLTEKTAALKKISTDAQAAGGSMVQVTEATGIMNFYRARAVEVYRQLYAFDKNYTYNFSK